MGNDDVDIGVIECGQCGAGCGVDGWKDRGQERWIECQGGVKEGERKRERERERERERA